MLTSSRTKLSRFNRASLFYIGQASAVISGFDGDLSRTAERFHPFGKTEGLHLTFKITLRTGER
jgi:hypothetical protein